MRKVGYNNQRDNFVVSGIPGSSQCFATSAWMLLSYYCPDKYKFDDDIGLKNYIEELTRSSTDNEYEWAEQAALIQKYLQEGGWNGEAKLGIDLNTGKGKCSVENLRDHLCCNPVIIGTKKMSGLPGGHIILGIDNADNGDFICHDPYGNAVTGYTDKNGSGVTYTAAMFDHENPTDLIRVLWIQE